MKRYFWQQTRKKIKIVAAEIINICLNLYFGAKICRTAKTSQKYFFNHKYILGTQFFTCGYI